jgi:methylated-DNA-protein-cysteine methyltransferase-like protein
MNPEKKTKDRQYSDNYRKIWETVKKIPAGKVASYGQIAKKAGLGSNAKMVGYAMHSLPENSDVPWHRVINAQGKISLRKTQNYYQIQKMLLEKEGIEFINERIDLNKFGWQG